MDDTLLPYDDDFTQPYINEIILFHDTRCMPIAKVEHVEEGILLNGSELLLPSQYGNYEDDERRRNSGENLLISLEGKTVLHFCNKFHHIYYSNWSPRRKGKLRGSYNGITIHQYRRHMECNEGCCTVM